MSVPFLHEVYMKLAPPGSLPALTRALTFEDHRRAMDGLRYVYPVLSRRARGISIGVNLNPDKACNFGCVYCQVDRRVEGFRGVDIEIIRQELTLLLEWVANGELFAHPPFDTTRADMRRVNDICFAGDGEPTSVPNFQEAVHAAIECRAAFQLHTLKVVLITNATMLHKPSVQAALEELDTANGEIWAKLDAGTDAYYQSIAQTQVPFARVLSNLELTARVRPLVIQSLFLELGTQGPSEDELDAYIARLRHILDVGGQLKLIQIYTVARQPPEAGVYALPNAALDAIADRVRAALPVPVETYYGSSQFMRALEV